MDYHCKYDELVDSKELKSKFHPKNRNKHPDDQIDRLVKILKYQGWRYAVKISKRSDKITSGHGRVLAAEKLKCKVPVVYQEYESDEQEYADVQADNAIASWAELDLSGINTDIGELGPDFDIDLLGIKDFEIEPADKFQGDEDAVPEEPKKAKTKTGDLYELGDHRLLCGDATNLSDFDLLLNQNKIQIVFTDPPYGVSYEKKCNEIANQSKSRSTSEIKSDDIPLDNLKEVIQQSFNNIFTALDTKSCYYVCSPQGGELGLMMMMMMQEACIPCRHMIIWVKNAPVFSMGRLDYDYKHEPILFGWSPKKTHLKSKKKGQWHSSVWDLAREINSLHPTMKPVALMENALLNSSNSGENCLDIFGGSGSTLIACEKTKRKCFMMEIEPKYCDVIVSRWVKFTGINEIKRNGEPVVWQDQD